MSNIFAEGTKRKVRFTTTKGEITIEDLWSLPLTSSKATDVNLDDLARTYFKQLKSSDDVSFVYSDKKSDIVVQLKFDIIKYIIDVKLAADKANADRRAVEDERQQLLDALADKKADSIKSLSVQELEARLNSLPKA